MTGLWITLGILLFLTLILFIRIRFIIDFHGEDICLTLKILGIPIRLMPKKEKRQRIRLSDYSYKAIQRQRKKEEKKNAKAALKAEKRSAKKAKEPPKEKQPLSDTISLIAELVKYLLGKFLGHLRIDVTEIKIAVGSEDAARTAIMYGIINQAAAALLDILGAITNVKKNRKNEIAVYADFTSEKIKADINIGFSLRIGHVFSIAIGTLFRYIGNMIKKAK
ncbi:MAG: DUF2953 domain-containing protein [Clostridia bacterium]|nr:DUF2953 domain-containing protein [Clostridia bacterium]